MPTYQYACTACGHRLEAVQTFTDEPLAECPACEGRLRKLFSAVGIVFKGPGFYRTDSRASGSSRGGASSATVGATPTKDTDKSSASKVTAASDSGSSSDSKPSGGAPSNGRGSSNGSSQTSSPATAGATAN